MAENIKLFRQGGMDGDDAIEFIGQEDFVEAYNLRVNGTEDGEEGLATNPESNTIINNTLPSGINKAIGAAGFEITRTAYSFIFNSQVYNVIAKLNYDSNTQTNVFDNLTDSGAENILPLSPEYYVNDIKLINDYLLAWTDGNYQPCITNLTRLEAGGYGVLTENDFLIIKAQPMVVPTVVFASDETKSVNVLKGSLFQFMYQYVYLDNEYSAYSIMSKREVPTQENTPSVGTNVTINNTLVIGLDIGTNRVQTLNVVARIGVEDFFTIRTVNRDYILALPNTSINLTAEVREAYNPATNIYYFCFYNDGLYNNVDPLETDLDYDHVPLKCETLENVNGNILALGGITEGYPRPEAEVVIQTVSYNPNVSIVPANPSLALRVENWQQEVLGRNIFGQGNQVYTKVYVYYTGVAQTGDVFTVVTSNINSTTIISTITYTVTSGQNGDTLAALISFRNALTTAGYPASVILFDTGVWRLVFTTNRGNYASREQALIVSVTLAGGGTGASISRAALKSNSSYQLFLWYKDRWGRYFPICTDESYVIKTLSYSQLQGLASMISWQILNDPPADAAYYGWGLSLNNTHQTTLWVQGTLSTALTTSTYFAFNINPLKKFNEAYPSSILSYEYSAGDRCTFVYYIVGDATSPKVWLDKIDVEVVDFEIVTTVVGLTTTIDYILKVNIPAGVSQATLTGNNVLLEIYTPKQRTEVINGKTSYTEQVMYEVGISYPIVNGDHSVTSGTITEGDVYIKSREMVNGVDLNQVDTLVVEDFNFSDFYLSAYASYGKPRTFNDEIGRKERKGVIRWSEVFQRDSLVNGLTKFYPENIYGDGDGETSSNYGWIRKIRQRNNVLVVLQELKVGYVPVFQTIVEDQSSNSQYALSTRLFNKVRYNGKNIGIGNAKESYAEWNNNIYFVDPFRSEPIRAGLDGVDTISGKMSKYFKRVLQEAYEAGKKIIGYYDIFYNEYLLTTETEGDILFDTPFNVLNWQLEDTYVIPANGISLTTQGTKGVATYNTSTGIATYTPNAGQTGSDSFTFSFTPSGGSLTTKKVCLTIVAGDNCPEPFGFVDVTNANLSQVYVSNQILIIGINIASPITITGAGEYRINGIGSWVTTAGTVVNNDYVEVRVTSSASLSTAVSTTLTVGCQSDTYTVTTAATTTTSTTSTTTTTTAAPTTTTTTATPTTTTTTTTAAPTTTTTSTTSTTSTSTTSTTTTTSTSTTTTTTLPPCICYNLINTTGSNINILITPCDTGVQISQLVPANSTVTECIVTGQFQNPPPAGITVQLCGGYVQACTDEASCSGCNASTTTTTTTQSTTTTTTQDITQISILVVDMYDNTSLDVCAYIDTAGVTPSGNIVSAVGALNFYVPGDTAANAYLLSSDNITPSPSLTRRFEWNINRLHFEYPNQTTYPTFTLQVRGRAGSVASVSGVYALKFPDQTMTMTGSLGSYIPSVTPAGGPPPTTWNSNVISGANGTVGIGVGNLILTFVYVRATNIINVTTY